MLKLGTEVVTSKDGSIAGLLGASPGASTAPPIMLDLMQKVFKDRLQSSAWQEKIKQIIPSYGTHLNDDPAAVEREWAYTSEVLQLAPAPGIDQRQDAGNPQNIDPLGEPGAGADPDINPQGEQ